MVRNIVGDMPLLVPGIGAQGGDIEATVMNGSDANFNGMMISSSRAILYASSGSDWQTAAHDEAKRTRDAINAVRFRA
jgi:orotidine-5'-phosphate decarboxylase